MSNTIPAAHVRTKRVYEAPAKADGERILVDRLWPRGLSKDEAAIDHWLRDLAPSDALRTWYAHKPSRWLGFRKRYAVELACQLEALGHLRAAARERVITLLYAAHDEARNNAVALRNVLLGRNH
ncbi:MAG: DUF488 family protein [Hyphomonadaceae bacterium]|nr:DUF488 family protein [Hyphomonadaceae bacterium]